MTISPDNKLTIAKVPFYCHLMEWGKFPIYLTLKCINIFFCHHLALSFRRMPMRNGRLCHSDDCKEEESPLLCAQEKSLHSHCHQHFSFRCFPFKYPYGLWQAIRTVVPPTEMIVPNCWNGCAKRLAQACQRGGTSKAYLLLLVRYAFSALQAYLQRDSLSSSQTGITAWYGWQ